MPTSVKIIDQSHEILRMDGLDTIELAGRTCYRSEEKITDTSADKFVRQLVKRGHDAMLEHGSATVRFVTSRSVTHELVRHRVSSFAQESQRYVNYGGKDIEFIWPVWCHPRVLEAKFVTPCIEFTDDTTHEEQIFVCSCFNAMSDYSHLLKHGWLPEQAREVLPNSTATTIVVTANYREWRHIMNLRAIGTTGRPHPQMQSLMVPLLAEFKQKLSTVFSDLISPGTVETP